MRQLPIAILTALLTLAALAALPAAGPWLPRAQAAPAPADSAGASGTDPPAAPPESSADSAETAESAESAEPAEPPAPTSAEEQLWRDRSAELVGLANDAAEMLRSATDSGEAFNRQLDRDLAQFSQLQRIYGISRGRPSEQEDILSQIRSIRRQIAASIGPLETSLSSVNDRLAEVRTIQASMAGQEAEPGDVLAASYHGSLQLAQSQLETARSGLEAFLEPGREALKSIDQSVAAIEADLPGTWNDYYFGGSGGGGLSKTWQELFRWISSLASRSIFIYPQTADDWTNSAVRFAITAAIMVLAASLAVKGAARIPGGWHDVLEKIVKGPWISMTLGASLLSAASHYGGSYFVFKLPGILLLILGLAALSWRLRLVTKPDIPESTPSPLSRLNKPAAVAVALLFSDVPAGALTILWAGALAIFLNWLRRQTTRREVYAALLLPERLSYGSTFLFALASLLITLGGYARLAILLFMGLYTLVNIIILGSALVALTSRACQLAFDPETRPVRHALLKSLAVPVSFLVSLISALPWLWAVPGSANLLSGLMTRGYTVGDASFDISRLILIVMIFLLFRSLKGLGVTSLNHLPDTLPNIERGVIPPLQGLFTYLLWAVFAVISLTMVGVNFSSLAVVVGGLSVGVGLGLQSLVNNLISGLILIFGRTVLVGDWVDVGPLSGRVVSVNIRCTVVETSEGAQVFVPNSTVMGAQFTNWTRNNRQCRKALNFNAVYGTDVEMVKRLMAGAAEADPDVSKFPAPGVTVKDLSEEAVVFTLAVTIRDIDLEVAVKSRLREAVYRLFNENGVRFYVRNELSLNSPAAEAVKA
jgi:small-conductance mechanosensitive channel